MLFSDEESRHVFHQQSAFAQMICTILESYAVGFGDQLEVFNAENNGGATMILVSCQRLRGNRDMLMALADKLNRTFRRKDKRMTCVLENTAEALLSVYVTDSADFELVH